MSGSDVTLILSRLDGIDSRLDGIEDMQGYTAMALLDLLVAMKEDEKVRSQMRATISGLRNIYQEKVAEVLQRRAS